MNFPSDPCFDALNTDLKAPTARWGVFGAHDPSLLEADGRFFAYSTGTFGENAYQIRTSRDLIHWQFVKQAFPQGLQSIRPAVSQVLELLGRRSKNETLWAPDVIRGKDGKYWLYGCYSAVFGDNYSVIFLARADAPDADFVYADTLVLTGGSWGRTPNAIDPQIYFTPGGEMYMSYGSFFGGIRVLQLDPATGRRKDGFTYEMLRQGKISEAQYYGEKLVNSANVEGSVMDVRKGVTVCEGDVFGGSYTAVKRDYYYLMASADSLSRDYNMRLWRSAEPCRGFTAPPYGPQGQKVCGSFSWRRFPGDTRIGFDFFAPGHNDLFTTKSGVDLVVYHNRSPFPVGKRPLPHYLFLSMFALNSQGDIVMSPNRYAGERLRKIEREELAGKSFDYIPIPQDNRLCVYANEGLRLEEDGYLTVRGERRGRWKLYEDYFVCFTYGNVRYFGAAMPAWIEAEGRPGITVSARGENGLPFFMNQSFA